MRRTLSIFGIAAAMVLEVSAPAFAQSAATSAPAGSSSTASGPPAGGMNGPGGLYDTAPQERGQMLSVWVFVPYLYGFGIGAGARYTLPIIKNGFIPNLNNSFELELGADLGFSTYGLLGYNFSYTQIIIPAEGRWTFHFTPAFAAYAKIGLGARLVFTSYAGVNPYGSGFHYDFALGALYKLGNTFAIRAETGYEGLKVGVGFEF